MSIQYDQEILKSTNLTLKVNFSGIKNSNVNAADLKMSIYAYDDNGQPKFTETLSFDQIKSLFEHLNQISIIKDSSKITSGKFIETTSEVVEILEKITKVDPGVLKIVLSKLTEDEIVKNLFTSLSDFEIDLLAGLQKQQNWRSEIENLKKLIQLEEEGNIVEEIKLIESLKIYEASQPEKIFQNWIDRNHIWVFGVEYIKKHDFKTTGLYNQVDIIMESMDGFLDLIELKRPKFEIFKYEESHKSYYPSTDLSKVIGQCLLYLQEMDDIKLKLEKEKKVKILRPRIKIIAGRTNNFKEEQYSALRMLNSSLNHIQIISYDYLLSCGEKMIAHYK